jgi:predicted GNAT superfamily acetyltransferase
MAVHLDTAVYQDRYGEEVRSERRAQAGYQQFLRWLDTARSVNTSPFRFMEADTAATIRLREAYADSYSMGDKEKMEIACSNTQEIKKVASKGKTIPPYLTDDEDAEWECRSVAWFYEKYYGASNIGRVLVAFATEGEHKGLPAFAVCVSATRLDSSSLSAPLAQQIRRPYMSNLLSVYDLRTMECAQFDGEGPVRGSMTTEYRTLYDYCTMKTRQGVFRDRTENLLSSRFEAK